jgi:hypothetical protein
MKKAKTKTQIKQPNPKIKALSKISTNSSNSAPNGPLEMKFPDLSIEKETALILFANGYSQRQISEKLGFHHSTFYSWKINDPAFNRHLTEVKAMMHEKIREESHCITNGMYGALIAFAQTDWSKVSLSELIPATRAAKDYLIATGNLLKTEEFESVDNRRSELLRQLYDELKSDGLNIELEF